MSLGRVKSIITFCFASAHISPHSSTCTPVVSFSGRRMHVRGTLVIWPLHCCCQCCAMSAGHVNEHFCLFAAFITADAKGKWVVCGSEDNSIFLWDLNKKDVGQLCCCFCVIRIMDVLYRVFCLLGVA